MVKAEKMTAQPEALAEARRQINRIDSELVALLAERFDAVTQVNDAKQAANLPVMDHGREDQVLKRVADKDPNPQTRQFMQAIFKTIMAESRNYQDQLKQN